MTAGTAGSLAAGEWDWADNDTLGFSTVYVRLTTGAADPDARGEGSLTFTDSPNANDNVYFRGSASINGGDFSGTELDDVIFMPGFSGTVGDVTSPLVLDMADSDRFESSATGRVYISIGNAAVSPVINRSAASTNGESGFNLVDCTALNDLFINGGSVGLLGSTVDDVYVRTGGTLSGDVDSACTADIHNDGGTVDWRGTGVDLIQSEGTATVSGTDAWALVEVYGGVVFYNSSGTLTQATAVTDGEIDFTNSSIGQTVTNAKVEGRGKITYNATTTLTNAPAGDGTRRIWAGR